MIGVIVRQMTMAQAVSVASVVVGLLIVALFALAAITFVHIMMWWWDNK